MTIEGVREVICWQNFGGCALKLPCSMFLFTLMLGLSGCAGFDLGVPGYGEERASPTMTKKNKAFLDAVKELERIEEANAAGIKEKVSPETCLALRNHITPRIHSIGLSKILTFEPPPSGKETDDEIGLEIAIEGRDLFYKDCLQVFYKVGGTINADIPRDVKPFPGPVGSGVFTIGLRNRYLRKIRTGDHIDVIVTVNVSPKFEPRPECRTVTYAHRRFTLYTVGDYRDLVQKAQVPANDIRAFPLPKREAEILFGPVVAENFFAVRLSIRNTTNDDKLISTGMIVASGRVLVEPKAREGCEDRPAPSFTIPVELVPQSLEQIYTMVADEEVNQTRSIVFRGLQFAGALAAATAGAYSGSEDLVTGIGLFTGVFIPELGRLWTDRWPGYQRNVVGFSMPDLFKVPKGTVAGHKYVFFSKKKLEAIISDQQYFGAFTDDQPEQPNVAVAQVRFDSLDIPFENVFAVQAVTLERQVANLKADLPRIVERIERIEQFWGKTTGSLLFGTLRSEDLEDAIKSLDTKKAEVAKKPPSEKFGEDRQAALKALRALAKAAKKGRVAIEVFVATLPEEGDLDTTQTTKVNDDIVTPLTELLQPNRELDKAEKAVATFAEKDTDIYSADAALLENRVASLNARREQLKESQRELATALTAKARAAVKESLATLRGRLEGLEKAATDARTQTTAARAAVDVLAGQIRIIVATANSLRRPAIADALINDSGHGLTALRDYERDLRDMFKDITAGRDIAGQREKVIAVRAEIETAIQKLEFYAAGADLFRGGNGSEILKLLKDLDDKLGKELGEREKLDALIGNLNLRVIQVLRRHHEGLSIVPELGDGQSETTS